jgi:hypothetical protein
MQPDSGKNQETIATIDFGWLLGWRRGSSDNFVVLSGKPRPGNMV